MFGEKQSGISDIDSAIVPDSEDKMKPEILTCYNKYKGGVDTVDHK